MMDKYKTIDLKMLKQYISHLLENMHIYINIFKQFESIRRLNITIICRASCAGTYFGVISRWNLIRIIVKCRFSSIIMLIILNNISLWLQTKAHQ